MKTKIEDFRKHSRWFAILINFDKIEITKSRFWKKFKSLKKFTI